MNPGQFKNPKWKPALLGALGFVALVWGTLTWRPQPGAAPLQENPNTARAPANGAALSENEALCANIYKTICGKTGVTRDPTGSVRPDLDGELLALRTYEEIIRSHPDWTSEKVDEEFVTQIYTPKLRGRMESAYRWVLHTMQAFIDAQPERVFTALEKKQLKNRLKQTKLQFPVPVSNYADEPDLLTKNDVFYERILEGTNAGVMRLRIGGAYFLTGKSWFNIVFTMAHELAHSIDPCEVRSINLSYPAYDRLTACFMKNGLVATRKTRSECGQNDQLSETFADWMAVHIASDALAQFSTEFRGPQLLSAATNSVRDLCEQEDDFNEPDLEFHPSSKTRIDRIFGRNPRIREILGCGPVKEGPEYCSF